MKTIIKVTGVVLLLLLTVVNIYANEVEKRRDVAVFSKISLRIPAQLYLVQDTEQQIKVVAKENTQNEIITEVKDDKLFIRFKTDKYLWQSFKPGEVKIYVSVRCINSLSVFGLGEIVADKKISSRFLDLSIMGSGKIQLSTLETIVLHSVINGSGQVLIGKGNMAERISCKITGSGSLIAPDFASQDVIVDISGSGSCKIKTNGKISGDVNGSGIVYYKGNPEIDKALIKSKSLEAF